MNSPSRVLLPITKKITKSNRSSSEKDEKKSEKKYKTYSKTVKKQCLHELWEGLIQLFDLSQLYDPSKPEYGDLLELFEQATISEKNCLITNILNKNRGSFPKGYLTDWRKTIKRWIEQIDKPERRGAPVVPAEKIDDFKDKVNEILDYIPFRSEPLLRSELIKVLRSYHESQNSGKTFDSNICSKHWWFNYREKNPDIREKWEAIPLERTAKKKTSGKSRTQGIVSGTISTAGVSLETSPARGEDQKIFDLFRLEMEEEKPSTHLDERNEFELNVEDIRRYAYLLNEDANLVKFDNGIDQFFADLNEDAQNQFYLPSPTYF